MNGNRRMLRQTLTIARRDFTATVFTPMFLLFLLSPLIMLSFSVMGALGGSTLAKGPADKTRMIAIVTAADGKALIAADGRLRQVFKTSEAPPPLFIEAPGADPAAQARQTFDVGQYDVAAAMTGPLESPRIIFSARGGRAADYLAQLAEQALRDRASGGVTPLSTPQKTPLIRKTASRSGHSEAAFFAVTGVFFLTLFLSGQAVGTMAEERSNKVIEVLAAAVPLEAVFLGKLIGMFGVAVLFVTFWGTLISQIGALLPPSGAQALAEIGPAIGFPTFLFLFFAYFTMAYMLLGAVFLGVGAQASTMREIQMLSLPITVVQMAMFGLASAASNQPGTTLALIAEIFPLSSPFAMAGHAANSAEVWPHVAALAWQLLWVAITISISAGAFRRGVLKSGSGRRRILPRLRRS